MRVKRAQTRCCFESTLRSIANPTDLMLVGMYERDGLEPDATHLLRIHQIAKRDWRPAAAPVQFKSRIILFS